MKVGLLLPTISEANMLRMIQSLDCLDIEGHELKWLVNFNKGFKPTAEILNGLEQVAPVEYLVKDYYLEMGVPLCQITREAAELWPDAHVYLRLDDDMIFTRGTPKYPVSSGKRYEQCLHYLERNPGCGLLKCDASLGGNYQRWAIASSGNAFPATKKGLFIRNLYDGDIFIGIEPLGAGEDLLMGYLVIENGYYYAKQFNNPTKLTSEAVPLYAMRPGLKMSNKLRGTKKLGDPEVWEKGVLRSIQDRWEDYWVPALRRYPKGLIQKFVENGGDIDNMHFRQHVIDYEDWS